MTQSMLRKNVFWLPLLLSFTLLLAACQNNEPEPTVVAPAPTVAEVATTAPTTAAVTETEALSETESVTTTATVTETAATTATTETATSAGEIKTFRFGEGTEARFYIDEVLMGQDKNVVGTTSLVEGEITIDPSNPASAQISPIRIDASDFTTDSDRRNGAIQRFVLQSGQAEYQYITFEPTAITGLPASVTVGEPIEFTVTGNLTIRNITREESFLVTVTPVSETEITGLGSATIQRANYELTIPSVPSVANVSEDVKLEIAFTATSS